MPIPSGVSVGDFIACLELTKTVIECLEESQGSAAQYRGLVRSLRSLEAALIQVNKVRTPCVEEMLSSS